MTWWPSGFLNCAVVSASYSVQTLLSRLCEYHWCPFVLLFGFLINNNHSLLWTAHDVFTTEEASILFTTCTKVLTMWQCWHNCTTVLLSSSPALCFQMTDSSEYDSMTAQHTHPPPASLVTTPLQYLIILTVLPWCQCDSQFNYWFCKTISNVYDKPPLINSNSYMSYDSW